MNTRLDPLAEPVRCPHGGEFIALPNGDVEVLTPCATCENQTVAPRQRDKVTAA